MGAASVLAVAAITITTYSIFDSKAKVDSKKSPEKLEEKIYDYNNSYLEEEIRVLKNRIEVSEAIDLVLKDSINKRKDENDKLRKEFDDLAKKVNQVFDNYERICNELNSFKKPEPVKREELLNSISMTEKEFNDRPKLKDAYIKFYNDSENFDRFEFEVNRFLGTVKPENREIYKKSMVKVVYESLTANKDVENEKDPLFKQVKETKKRAAFHMGLEKARAGIDLTLFKRNSTPSDED